MEEQSAFCWFSVVSLVIFRIIKELLNVMYVLTQIGHSVLRRICLYYIPYGYGDRLFDVGRGSFLKYTEIVNISSARKPVRKLVSLL
jgi:hypothetical protein